MKDLELIMKALNKANGSFTMEESAVVFNAIQSLAKELQAYQQLKKQDENRKNAVKPKPTKSK